MGRNNFSTTLEFGDPISQVHTFPSSKNYPNAGKFSLFPGILIPTIFISYQWGLGFQQCTVCNCQPNKNQSVTVIVLHSSPFPFFLSMKNKWNHGLTIWCLDHSDFCMFCFVCVLNLWCAWKRLLVSWATLFCIGNCDVYFNLVCVSACLVYKFCTYRVNNLAVHVCEHVFFCSIKMLPIINLSCSSPPVCKHITCLAHAFTWFWTRIVWKYQMLTISSIN